MLMPSVPKRGQNPAGAGSVLFAIQIYDIFRQNPNPVSISQQPHNCENAAICSSDPLAGVILRGVHIEVGVGIPRHEKEGAEGRIPIDFVIDNNWLLCADTARCFTFFLFFALCNLGYPS